MLNCVLLFDNDNKHIDSLLFTYVYATYVYILYAIAQAVVQSTKCALLRTSASICLTKCAIHPSVTQRWFELCLKTSEMRSHARSHPASQIAIVRATITRIPHGPAASNADTRGAERRALIQHTAAFAGLLITS